MRQLRVTLQHVHPRRPRALRRVHARLHAAHGCAAAAGPPHRGHTWHMREVRATLQRLRHGGAEQVRHVRPAPHARRAHGAARRGARVRALRQRLPQVLGQRRLQDVPPLTRAPITLALWTCNLPAPAPQHTPILQHPSHLPRIAHCSLYYPLTRCDWLYILQSNGTCEFASFRIVCGVLVMVPLPHTVAACTTYGCNLYHIRLQPPHGCSLHHTRLQPLPHAVAASITHSYSFYHTMLHPLPHTVAASPTHGCSLRHIRLQPLPRAAAGGAVMGRVHALFTYHLPSTANYYPGAAVLGRVHAAPA